MEIANAREFPEKIAIILARNLCQIIAEILTNDAVFTIGENCCNIFCESQELGVTMQIILSFQMCHYYLVFKKNALICFWKMLH